MNHLIGILGSYKSAAVAELPPAPTTVTMAAYIPGSTTVSVSWSAVTGATSYTVQFYSNTTAIPGTGTATSFGSAFTNVTGTSQSSSTTLVANTYYYASVITVNSAGSSVAKNSSITRFNISPSNPLVFLRANTYSGSGIWNDESANGRNATSTEGTISRNAALNGIVLNGSSAWSFANVAAGNAWTISVWFKRTTNTSGYPMVVGQLNSPYNMILNYNPSQQFQFAFVDTAWRLGKLFTPTLNTWTHMVGTWNGTQLSTYVGGTLIPSGTTTPGGSSIDSTSAYAIGKDVNKNYATGEIGEILIYNYALSASQISDLYDKTRLTYA